MIRFPELRQMVYSLNDSSIGYSSTVVKQTQPGIDLHITANTEWKMYLERYGHFYVDIKTRDESFSFRMQAQQTELTAFEIEEDVWMATVMLTPFAAFAPESANDSTVTFAVGDDAYHHGYRVSSNIGSLTSTTGFIPEGLVDLYYDDSNSKIHIGLSEGTDWPYLWPLESITVEMVTYPVEFQLASDLPNALNQSYYNTTNSMWHESVSDNMGGYVWDSGTTPNSTDITTPPTAADQNAWDNNRWYTSALDGYGWGSGETPSAGAVATEPAAPTGLGQTYYNTTNDEWHESESDGGSGFQWGSGISPDSTDISVDPTAADQHAWISGSTLWYTSSEVFAWGTGEFPTEGLAAIEPAIPNRWRTVDNISMNPFTSGPYTATFNWKWTPDRFLDINMTNTSFTEI